MKKWVKILGVLGGLGLAGAGVAALCKKNTEDADYVEGYVSDDEVDTDDSAEESAE